MYLYNSLSKTKELFVPFEEGKVKIYTCGPTVYNFAHIGNYRSYIFEDILVRGLRYLGYDVKRAMNITDVGHLSGDSDTGKDKMVEEAKKENKGVLEIAKFYTDAFKKDFEHLNLEWPEIVIPATSCVDIYIEIIEKLLNKGYAYISGGNVYFDITKLNEYNVFFNQNKEDMLVAAREDVDDDSNKKNPGDFALWFTKSKFENQALKWDSPWGVGYPGWHIECSGISYKYLGEYLDIHCGGVDNKFPHHTNEIAQSESFLGHSWCKYWFHVAHLNLKEGKMSKSLGNFIRVEDLIKDGYSPLSYKLLCLQSFYRKDLIFSYEALNETQKIYDKIKRKISEFKTDEELQMDKINEYDEKFKEAINNDLNTAMMITVLFDVLKSDLNDTSKKYLIENFDKVLGLDLLNNNEVVENSIDEELKKYIELKIEERKNAKSLKDFKTADKIRQELLEKNIELIDSREGTTYKIIN